MLLVIPEKICFDFLEAERQKHEPKIICSSPVILELHAFIPNIFTVVETFLEVKAL